MRKFILDYWKTALWLIGAGFSMALIYAAPWIYPWSAYIRIGSFTASLWVLLGIGNNFMAHLVSERFPWTKAPVKTFIIGMIVTIGYTIIALYVDVLFFEYVLGIQFLIDIKEFIWTSLIVTIIISLFMHSRGFLLSLRSSELTSERLQKESMKAQFDSLKSQVNPHFLFNSLNALTNLIYENQDKAVRFVKQLSEVYRYVLDTQGREIVPLSDEVKFLKSYIFLQQIRFGDKLKMEIDLDSVNAQIAPLVLQMLMENAIKHNVISMDEPLTIRIYSVGNQIIIENNIQKKDVLPEESKGIGLANIKKRYSFLTDRPVEIIQSNSFVVKLPFL